MKYIYLLGILLFLSSCTIKVSPIDYGVDTCDFCKMGIVDNKFASQLVTAKGKNHKFDAIECMISYLSENEKQQGPYAHILVSDLKSPGVLIPGQEAIFIVSKNVPSPMGAFLSATKKKEDALQIISENTGEMFTYNDIIKRNMKH